jgi:DNA-binding IclR family transcriptional regulator
MASSGDHRTTARILDIIELVVDSPEGLSLADISRSLEAPKSSLFPLLGTLVARNYLKLNAASQKYCMGEQLFILGNSFVNKVGIMEEIRAVTDQLCKDTGETIYFGVLSGLDVLYLIKSDLYSNFRVMSNPGVKLPAYSTGYGKSLLSQFSPEQIKAFYPDGKLKQVTEDTVRDVDTLLGELEEVRRSGFSHEKGESTPGIQCIAAPITHDSKIVAGISIAVPQFRYTEDREVFFRKYLSEAVRKIETLIDEHHEQWNYN